MIIGPSAVPSCTSDSDASSAAGVTAAGVDVEDEAVDGGRRMSWRWASYQDLVSSSIWPSLPPIRNARSVFLFFAMKVAFSKAIRTP
jgi:hypothetical protein